ncbi:MAG: hypothetical protein Q8P82_00750 [bacterium]|nr:hypothetical protein [bacterium]
MGNPWEECDQYLLEVELNVPSGQIAVADHLGTAFNIPEEEEDSYDMRGPNGKMEITRAVAALGCAHGFVGNTCPSVYQVNEGLFTIATSGWERDEIGLAKADGKELSPEGKQVASVVTDLWWYSLADAEEFRRRPGEKREESYVQFFAVKPGVYRVTHFAHHPAFDRDAMDRPLVFARIEWVRSSN